MSKKDSGDFFGDMIKLWGAVQASKGSDGKPDPYKAAGIAAGLGHTSLNDFGMLGAMLGSEGAFDDNNSSSGYIGGGSYEPDDSWRDFCDDGSGYGLDPYDYDSEDEYEEALEEAQEEFDQYETIEDESKYNTSLEDSDNDGIYKVIWEVVCSVFNDYVGLDISQYKTKEEITKAIEHFKGGWRDSCENRKDYFLNPYRYKTEAEYVAVLEYAKRMKKRYDSIIERCSKTSYIDENYAEDTDVFTYCGVVYEDNTVIYHYISEDETVNPGDSVIVPVGNSNEEKQATVVSVGKYLRAAAPYPPEKTKKIIRKA